MGVILRGARVFRPASPGLEETDIAIADGQIREIASVVKARDGDREVDCSGLVICAGFVDLYARLGEPGFEYREDIETATRAAAAGGYVAVCAAPDSSPINDTRAVTELLIRRAAEVGSVPIWPLVALTAGLEGHALAELGELADAGAVAACTGDAWPSNGGLMRRGFEYARTFGLPVLSKPCDSTMAGSAAAHESPLSTRLGLHAVPAQAETAALARDIELAELTGARYIASHVSTARAVTLIREAKSRGVDVVGAVSIHNLLLDESAIAEYDPAAKLWPPLRGSEDRIALVAGLADGTIDCVISDHDPKAPVDKQHEFDDAESGAVSLEIVLGGVMELVATGQLSLERGLDALCAAPRRAVGRGDGSIAVGGPADLCVIDPGCAWTVTVSEFRSKSKSTPLAGRRLHGRVELTLVSGEVVYDREGNRV